jgi:hypothetical protein
MSFNLFKYRISESAVHGQKVRELKLRCCLERGLASKFPRPAKSLGTRPYLQKNPTNSSSPHPSLKESHSKLRNRGIPSNTSCFGRKSPDTPVTPKSDRTTWKRAATEAPFAAHANCRRSANNSCSPVPAASTPLFLPGIRDRFRYRDHAMYLAEGR